MLPKNLFVRGNRYIAVWRERRSGERRLAKMRVRLVRKLADWLDGIDVSAYQIGDVFELPRRDAELLIEEGWAVPVQTPLSPTKREPDALRALAPLVTLRGRAEADAIDQ